MVSKGYFTVDPNNHCGTRGESITFSGIQDISVVELGLSQIYLNEDKLANIQKWINPNDLSRFNPLPVHDFGNCKLTLTDGHSRAFCAYMLGIERLPVIYDTDEIVTSETGQLLYKNDIIWCERFNIHSVCDLKDRVLSNQMYQELWVGRCDKAYHLLTQTSELQRKNLQSICPHLYLDGATEDLNWLFFEDEKGTSFSFPANFCG